MKDRGYDNRYRGDLISIIRLLIFIAVIFAFVAGVLVKDYFQGAGDQTVPRKTTIPASRQERPLLYQEPGEGSRLILEEESPPSN